MEFRLAFRGTTSATSMRFWTGSPRACPPTSRRTSGCGRSWASPSGRRGSTGDAGAVVARARAEADEIVRRAAGAGRGDPGGAGPARERRPGRRGAVPEPGARVPPEPRRSRADARGGDQADGAGDPRAGRGVAGRREAARPPTPSSVRNAPGDGRRARAPSAPRPPRSPGIEPASAAEIRERLQAASRRSRSGRRTRTTSRRRSTPPIVVESATEPVFSTDGAPATERRERSLRELFWGED